MSNSSAKLGRLERVDLRSAWASEAQGFTPWLGQEENLSLLGETIGLDLELESQEQNVGPFRADLLCKNTEDDSWVLIENQLARTDHTHLGQLITYAAGLKAVTIVWIAERFTEEHRAALDWLNERTDDAINLFGLEVELWRIGESPIAPKFNIVCQPNDWSRTVQRAAVSSGEVTSHKQLQLRFWTGFREFMQAQKSFVRCQKPLPQHWTNHAIGRSGIHLSSIISTKNTERADGGPELRVELVIANDRADADFAALDSRRAQIVSALGPARKLVWHNPEGVAAKKLYVRTDGDFLDEPQWPRHFTWLKNELEAMHRVFAPLAREIREDQM